MQKKLLILFLTGFFVEFGKFSNFLYMNFKVLEHSHIWISNFPPTFRVFLE